MNALRNKVQLIGNLGMSPEVTELEGGRKVAKFTLATNETYKNQSGERVQNTNWHNIVAWGKTAELMAELLAKGKEVMVEGKLTNRSWDDKDGNKRYITEVIAHEFLVLTPREQDSNGGDVPF
ncbi:MAG: single-stranded DNA-binding protein [Bacteroidetes bacterium]|nr:MAG: single-stranded DNA-binding protein [Bacteroidota bacterium]